MNLLSIFLFAIKGCFEKFKLLNLKKKSKDEWALKSLEVKKWAISPKHPKKVAKRHALRLQRKVALKDWGAK